MNPKETISFVIPLELKEKLLLKSQETHLSVSTIIRQSIKKYLEQNEN